MEITGNLIDVHTCTIFPAKIHFEKGRIVSIKKTKEEVLNFILPGFVDAHVHIESSMVTPAAFSRTAIKHGTIGLVTDPHEIGNVMGVNGVKFMIDDAKHTPVKILFGAPSCVPATEFESSGAGIDVDGVRKLLQMPEVGYLSEVMNYPGVINDDKELLAKIKIAKDLQVPIDGHAPGVKGENLKKYANAGIGTDHECVSLDEAIEKISLGMKILIREGSGAKNFMALIPLLKAYPDQVMFCSDDLHPDDLISGHINRLVKRALDMGFNLFDVLRAAGLNAINHYKLDVGLLREKDPADFIVVDSLENFKVLQTYINGKRYYNEGEVNIPVHATPVINNFNIEKIKNEDILVPVKGKYMKVIKAIDGELITKIEKYPVLTSNGYAVSNLNKDILKIVVVNRYTPSPPAVAFIQGFGLKHGALASSISHDSHNIVCVGTSDYEIVDTINWIIENKGGIAIHTGENVCGLTLEIGGIISTKSVEDAGLNYLALSNEAKKIGSKLKAPFMTLAFMALLVIPELKLSDRGLFDGISFSFTSLFYDN